MATMVTVNSLPERYAIDTLPVLFEICMHHVM